MTAVEFLEVSVSLSAQVAVLVIVVHWITKLTDRDALKSRLWAGCHLFLLGLTLRAFLLPRNRPFFPWATPEPATTLDIVLWQQRLGWIVFVLWLFGAVCSLLVFLWGWRQVQRFLRTCHPIDDAGVLERIHGGSEKAPQSIPELQFYISPRLQSPFCWQVHRPLIVLPEFLMDFPTEELRLVVRHEMEHLQTGHPLTLFVQRIVEILFWFHPMVWWSSRQAALAREFACDEAAVNSQKEIVNYLRSLLKIVECTDDEAERHSIELAFGRGPGMIARRAARLVALARQGVTNAASPRWQVTGLFSLIAATTVTATFLWMPLDFTKSPRSAWSPWPSWSANALHSFGVQARDYDVYDHRYQIHELLEDQRSSRHTPH